MTKTEAEGRIATGMEELDEMLGGGFLPKQCIIIAGQAGAGKTIAALQFLHANLKNGKKCLFISASDDEKSIVTHSLKFGWNLGPYVDSNKLTIVNIELMEVEHGLMSDIPQQVPKIIKGSKADIVVLDSITEFNDLCTSDMERRARLMDIRKIIKEIGATGLLTAEVGAESKKTKYGVAEYVFDGLILLSRFQSDDFSQFITIIQIIKMRWVQHSRELRAYSITNSGIVVQSPLYTLMASTGKIG